MKKKWTIQILCMLGILLMFSSCYHRRAHHQMHAAMVEYSNKQLDSISFSTTPVSYTHLTLPTKA